MTIANVTIDDAVAASTINALIDRINLLDGATNRTILTGPASGVYTVPDGVTKIKVLICGGGGGGGAGVFDSGSGTTTPGGFGGLAPMGSLYLTDLEPGASISYALGAGGTTTFGLDGGNGGNSNLGSYISSTGGSGGTLGGDGSLGATGVLTGADIQVINQFFILNTARAYGGGGAPSVAGGPGILVIEY